MVLRFLCGLRKFSGYSSEVLNTLCVKTSGDNSANIVHMVSFDTLHWLFEAQDSDVIADVLGSSNIQPPNESFRTVTPFDCFVLGYCVSHSSCTWKISCDIGDEGVELFVRGTVEEETHCTGGIFEVNLMYNNITSEGVKHLLKFRKKIIYKLETLTLRHNKLDSGSCATLAHLIPHVPNLKGLNLSDNPNIGQGGAVPLITSLTADDSLEWLGVSRTGIDVEDCQALSELLSSSTSLKELDISFNALPSEAVELIISGLHHNTSLEWLHMGGSSFTKMRYSGSHFSLQNIISLSSVLRTNHTLGYLNLVDCKIDSEGACQLASALGANDTLQKLILCSNPIGVKGATAFAEMLLKNKSLKELYLDDNSIGEEGTQKLIDSLTHNATMKKLALPFNCKYNRSSRVDERMSFSMPLFPPPSQQLSSLPPSQQYQL